MFFLVFVFWFDVLKCVLGWFLNLSANLMFISRRDHIFLYLSSRDHFIITLIISDRRGWRDTRGKWLGTWTGASGTTTLALSFFWMQSMAPWIAGSGVWMWSWWIFIIFLPTYFLILECKYGRFLNPSAGLQAYHGIEMWSRSILNLFCVYSGLSL